MKLSVDEISADLREVAELLHAAIDVVDDDTSIAISLNAAFVKVQQVQEYMLNEMSRPTVDKAHLAAEISGWLRLAVEIINRML